METLFVAGDLRGSTRVMRDRDGQPAAWFGYDPFGIALDSQHGGDPDLADRLTRRYTGQIFEPESGLHHYGARLCDAALARFASVDPAQQTPSPYAYCANDPIDHVDPDGRVITRILRYQGTYYLVDEFGYVVAVVPSARALWRLFHERIGDRDLPSHELLFDRKRFPALPALSETAGKSPRQLGDVPFGSRFEYYAEPTGGDALSQVFAAAEAAPSPVMPWENERVIWSNQYTLERLTGFGPKMSTLSALQEQIIEVLFGLGDALPLSDTVRRMLLPSLLADVLRTASEDHAMRVLQLIKSHFPALYQEMLEDLPAPKWEMGSVHAIDLASALAAPIDQTAAAPGPPPGPPGPALADLEPPFKVRKIRQTHPDGSIVEHHVWTDSQGRSLAWQPASWRVNPPPPPQL